MMYLTPELQIPIHNHRHKTSGIRLEFRYIVTQTEAEGPEYMEVRILSRHAPMTDWMRILHENDNVGDGFAEVPVMRKAIKEILG